MDVSESIRIPVAEWRDVIRREYLSDYLPSGGSAVRFISGTKEVVDRAAQLLADDAGSLGFFVAKLDPSCLQPDGKRPDYHRIDKLFFGISQSFDWKLLAERHLREMLRNLGLQIPEGWSLGGDLSSFLQANGLDEQDFVNRLQRAISKDVVNDRAMALEFRSAVSALAFHRIIPDAHLPTTEEVVLRWVSGAKAAPGDTRVLKLHQIYGRINRSNARHMLVSLSHWIRKAGYAGLTIIFDFRPYEYQKPGRFELYQREIDRLRKLVAEMPAPNERPTEEIRVPNVTYSKLAHMHMVHLLRAFLDEIEVFERLLFVVLTTDGYYDTDAPRNYRNYDALHTRIANEVHGQKGNPRAILCHLKEDL